MSENFPRGVLTGDQVQQLFKFAKKKSFALKIRNYFFTGVIVLIPIAFTLYLTKLLLNLSSKILPEKIKHV